MQQQLTLSLQLPDDATFANFFPGANQPLIHYLQEFIANDKLSHEFYLYLWGGAGAGCSHLLQACCHALLACGKTAVYLPLQYVNEFTPAIFNDLEQVALVCVDDVQHIAGSPAWEEALFHFFNRIQTAQNKLIIVGHSVPKETGIQLPDLSSRLNGGIIRQIQALTDEEKITALQLRARLRGFDLPDNVAQFLLQQFPRNFSFLFKLLETMDKASLAAQRKLTLRFVKTVLENLM